MKDIMTYVTSYYNAEAKAEEYERKGYTTEIIRTWDCRGYIVSGTKAKEVCYE